MTETAPAAAPAQDSIAEVMTPNAPASNVPERLSPSDAGRILSEYRRSKSAQPQAAAPEAAPAQTSPQEGDAAAPVEEPPGEQTHTADPVEETQPPIEPPRSWTQERKEQFRNLPRGDQEWLAEQERTRELDLRKGHNEVIEQRKAAEAEAKAMADARAKYEAALPQLLQHVANDLNTKFPDIRTQADLDRLAYEDPLRKVAWDHEVNKVRAVQDEIQLAQQRQQTEQTEKWSHFVKREDELFLEKSPELKDPAKAAKMRDAALSTLTATGFSKAELDKMWETPQLRDHRMQQLILKAAKYDEAQKNALKNPIKPNLPPVNRPGVAQPNKGPSEVIKDLDARVDRLSGLKQIEAAAKLTVARRQSR